MDIVLEEIRVIIHITLKGEINRNVSSLNIKVAVDMLTVVNSNMKVGILETDVKKAN